MYYIIRVLKYASQYFWQFILGSINFVSTDRYIMNGIYSSLSFIYNFCQSCRGWYVRWCQMISMWKITILTVSHLQSSLTSFGLVKYLSEQQNLFALVIWTVPITHAITKTRNPLVKSAYPSLWMSSLNDLTTMNNEILFTIFSIEACDTYTDQVGQWLSAGFAAGSRFYIKQQVKAQHSTIIVLSTKVNKNVFKISDEHVFNFSKLCHSGSLPSCLCVKVT